MTRLRSFATLFWRLSRPELLARPLRTILAAIGISAGVALIAGIQLVNRAVVEHFRQSVLSVAGPVELQITAVGGEQTIDPDLAAVAGSVPGVRAAMPVIDVEVPMYFDDRKLRLFATDLSNVRNRDAYGLSIEGVDDLARLVTEPNAILVVRPDGNDAERQMDAVVPVAGPAGRVDLRIAGYLAESPLLRAVGRNFVVIDIASAQQLLGLGNVADRIDVVPVAGADVDVLAATLRAGLGAGVDVASPAGRGEVFEQAIASFQAAIQAFGLVALLTGVFVVYSSTSTSISARSRSIAICRSVGLTRTGTVMLLAFEAAVLGLIASAIGTVAGIKVAHRLVPAVQATMGMVFLLPFEVATVVPSLADVATWIALGSTATVAGAIFPAIRVARADSAATLADRSSVRVTDHRALLQVLPAVVILVVVVLACLVLEVRWRSLLVANVASLSWFTALILFAVPATAWLAPRMMSVLHRAFGPPGRTAARSVASYAGRYAVAVAVLALCVATQVTFAGLLNSFERSLLGYIRGFMQADLFVASTRSQGGWLEQPIRGDLVEVVREVPGVAGVSAFRLVPGQRLGDDRVAVLALSDDLLTPTHYEHWFVDGSPDSALDEVRSGEGVLISRTLSHLSDVGIGDSVTLDTPSGALRLPVRGVVVDYTSDRGSVIVPLELFRKHWRDDRVSRIHVYAAPGHGVEDIRGRIASALPDSDVFKILTIDTLLEYQRDQVVDAFAPARTIEIMMLLVMIAGIVEVVIANVSERRRDLALLRANGATVEQVEGSIMAEATVLILAGVSIGAVGGLASAWMWTSFHFTYLLGWILDFHVPWAGLIQASLISAAAAAAAAYLPAKIAARLPIMEALHYE